ncbi:universal stress protein [Saccharopolyspora rhizosphaerae]|uniref:Universal stress protein n=1 Tax=Saccharopolyspora rhizosphaerae TaxID=2492662 RepID=A0A3R8VBB4_9PSEU|nr:universal stress protein [Saccharopolyspora rhizosphaerae]RRO13970.1 universal stress protein [Saccharopolyspora rhizosphaerae]
MREVVGVDGSEPALEAVRWAAVDAWLHRRSLRLVCAVPQAPEPAGPGLDEIKAERPRWLSEAVTAARAAAKGMEFEQVLRHGMPGEVLLDESQEAERLVVGTRGLNEVTGVRLALGSTAELVAMRSRCPVVVVPDSAGREDARTGPVIVGVDGSRVGEPALGAAYEEASLRGAPLVAVHVWSDVATDEWFGPGSADWEAIRVDQERVLAERLAGWEAKYPDVSVERVVARDRPVRFLVEHGAGAQLIVVGSRGRGGITGMLIGSTSRALLHCAPCPVLVVRAP